MYTDSNNRYDIFTWIKTIIYSSKTDKHFLVCIKLIGCFYRQTKDETLTNILKSKNNSQINKIIQNEKKSNN